MKFNIEIDIHSQSMCPECFRPTPEMVAEVVRHKLDTASKNELPFPWWTVRGARGIKLPESDASPTSPLVFPEFDPIIAAGLGTADRASHVIDERNGEPPDDWPRYFVLMPGASVCAGLFLAVTPPGWGRYVVAYDEVVQKDSDAAEMANACVPKISGKTFEAMLIDGHGGRITPMGMAKTVAAIYEEAFAHQFIFFTFYRVTVDLEEAIKTVRDWVTLPTAPGHSQLRLVTHRVPRLVKDFADYKWTPHVNQAATPTPRTPVLDCLLTFAQWHHSQTSQRTGGC